MELIKWINQVESKAEKIKRALDINKLVLEKIEEDIIKIKTDITKE